MRRSAHGLQLEPGCAQGKPLRALAVQGNDTKFFERHASLLTALLDERFDRRSQPPGLVGFWAHCPKTTTGCSSPRWPPPAALCADARARQRAASTPAARSRILLVEKRTLPAPTASASAQDHRIAVLGAGLNLGWLAAPWLQERTVCLLGRPDTWRFACSPSHAAMCRTCTRCDGPPPPFSAHQHLAVAGTGSNAPSFHLCAQTSGKKPVIVAHLRRTKGG